MRALATIRRVIDIQPIPKADAIEVATVDGWKVVVKKGEFAVGDLGVYFEVDSWMPETIAPFLSKGREYKGIPGERLRTIKLRGQLSQGLLLPRGILEAGGKGMSSISGEGDDVTEILGIEKWERAISPEMAGLMKGNFPSFIPKTDQERIQNLVKEISTAYDVGMTFELTEKLEGSSMTAYLFEGEFGVCSRNIDLKETEGNAFWKIARAYDIENKLRGLGEAYAIQGELVGPSIQGNIYELTDVDFYVYDVYDIKSGEYLRPDIRRLFVEKLGLKHVPVISERIGLGTVAELLTLADGKSVLADTLREGLVYKQVDGGMTFKTISNEYLLKHGD